MGVRRQNEEGDREFAEVRRKLAESDWELTGNVPKGSPKDDRDSSKVRQRWSPGLKLTTPTRFWVGVGRPEWADPGTLASDPAPAGGRHGGKDRRRQDLRHRRARHLRLHHPGGVAANAADGPGETRQRVGRQDQRERRLRGPWRRTRRGAGVPLTVMETTSSPRRRTRQGCAGRPAPRRPQASYCCCPPPASLRNSSQSPFLWR
ncbi:hypothetical protein B296_00016817 [Ensete ventricosum]|uniref:Uncharacterized protein n=1 Tax=Ensete ventricosum TaxID=4639 RepID=A0A427A0V4_ENSVE|nr:hypothetical protein B296_00016817 [Ensete ventricosum]